MTAQWHSVRLHTGANHGFGDLHKRTPDVTSVFRFWAFAGFLVFCACGPPAPIRLQSPPLNIYRAFDPKNRMPTVRGVEDEIEITVEEFVSIDKSREVFDTDLAGYGILALFITITNNSFHDYTIERGAISTYLDAQALLPLSAKEAAEQSTAIEFQRRVKAQDIAYGVLAFNPAGLVVIGSHMLDCLGNSECSFKQERERRKHAIEYDRKNVPLHFEKLELRYAPLRPGEKAEGFV